MDDRWGSAGGLSLTQAWGAPAIVVALTLLGLGVGWLVGIALHALPVFVLLGAFAGAAVATLVLYRTIAGASD